MSKVLTVKNPWASLIVRGVKDVENRSRRTKYRGTVLIHSSKQSINHIKFSNNQWDNLGEVKSQLVGKIDFPNSSIIGQIDIVDCVQNSKSIWAAEGQWHWILENPVKFNNPVLNIKGQLGLWNYLQPDCQRCGDEGQIPTPFNLCDNCMELFKQEMEMEVEMEARSSAARLERLCNKNAATSV